MSGLILRITAAAQPHMTHMKSTTCENRGCCSLFFLFSPMEQAKKIHTIEEIEHALTSLENVLKKEYLDVIATKTLHVSKQTLLL